jgi:hypothetical protein
MRSFRWTPVALIVTAVLAAGCGPQWSITSVTINGPAPLGGTNLVNPVDLVAPSQRVVDMGARISRGQGFQADVFFEALLTSGQQSGWASPFRIIGNNSAGHGPLLRATCAENGGSANLTMVFSREPILAHEQRQLTTFTASGAPSAAASIAVRVQSTDARRGPAANWDAPNSLMVTCRLPIPVPTNPGPGTSPIN